MKHFLILILIIFSWVTLHSQEASPLLQSLIAAETNFASFSKTKNTRDAFLNYTNDSSIVFSRGLPVNGYNFWSRRKADESYLYWWPGIANISASGELGFTTGPYVWRPDRNNPKPVDGGYYFTIWKKDENGEWKIAADLGSGKYDSSQYYSTVVQTDTNRFAVAEITTYDSERQKFLDFEKSYNHKLIESNKSLLLNFLSHNVCIYRLGQNPYRTIESARSCLNAEEKMKFNFEHSGGAVALSSDMAYSYGIVKYIIIKDGKEQEMTANYLRAWRNENGEWKIIVDLIGE